MNETSIFETLTVLNIIEWIAVILGLAYIILISQKNIFAWFCAIIGSGCSMFLCFVNQLYLESFLSLFYILMGIWGWIHWTKTRTSSTKDGIKIIRWNWKFHAINILISSIVTLLLGYIFSAYTDQQRPYVDAFTTVFSLAATFMVTQKVLENWIYWIVIDFVTIDLYLRAELYKLSGLAAVYTILAIYGYFQWKKTMKTEQNEDAKQNTDLLDSPIL